MRCGTRASAAWCRFRRVDEGGWRCPEWRPIMMRDSFIPRAAMLSLALAMSACAARPAAPDPEVVRLDGVYRGTETTEATGADCAGSVRPVQFRVADGHV